MRLPMPHITSQNMPQNSFTFGNKPVTTMSAFGQTPALGCIMKPPPNPKNNDDSEDDFPICQASLPNPLATNCTPQFGKPGMGGLGMGMQFGYTKSNQMLFVHLKNMRAQVEQANSMIDSLYQILSQPHILNATQVEQIHIQINTMRNSISSNNNCINEIYRIMSS